MSGTFTPQPAAAPLARMALAQARLEAKLLLRNGEQLLLALVIPVLVLVGGVLAARRLEVSLDPSPVAVLTPGVLALAVMSTSFTALAVATGFDRRYGALKRLGVSPLPRTGLLLGKAGALVVVLLLQALVIGVVALVMGWRPDPLGMLPALTIAVLGVLAFAGLGMLIAGVLRAEATLAAANLIYLLLMTGGGVVLPTATYGAAAGLLRWLPSGALGDGLRAALLDQRLDLAAAACLVAWAVLGAALTARFFRWE